MSYTVTKMPPKPSIYWTSGSFSEQLQMSYNELHYQLQTNDFSKIVHV